QMAGVREAGSYCLRGLLEHVLARLPGGKRVANYLNWLPAFLVLFNQGLVARGTGDSGRIFLLSLGARTSGDAYHPVDVLFLVGMAEGLLDFIRVDRSAVRIVDLAFDEATWPAGVPHGASNTGAARTC